MPINGGRCVLRRFIARLRVVKDDHDRELNTETSCPRRLIGTPASPPEFHLEFNPLSQTLSLYRAWSRIGYCATLGTSSGKPDCTYSIVQSDTRISRSFEHGELRMRSLVSRSPRQLATQRCCISPVRSNPVQKLRKHKVLATSMCLPRNSEAPTIPRSPQVPSQANGLKKAREGAMTSVGSRSSSQACEENRLTPSPPRPSVREYFFPERWKSLSKNVFSLLFFHRKLGYQS